MWGLVLDGVVAALLLLTIITALVLNRRLGSLNREKATLQALVNTLAEMSSRAENAVSSLRVTAEQSGRGLLQSVERAEKLSTDLHFVIDRGNSVADRLDETLRAARAETRGDAAAPRAVERPAERPADRSVERAAEKPVRAAGKPAEPRHLTRPAERAERGADAEDKPARPRRPPGAANRSATILGQLYGEGILEEGGNVNDDVASRAERDLLRALDGRR